jgi:hypothetical protein
MALALGPLSVRSWSDDEDDALIAMLISELLVGMGHDVYGGPLQPRAAVPATDQSHL